MRKKLLILGVIVAFIIASITTVQAATATVDLKVSNENVKPGDTFTVTLSASCADGISLIDTKYTYDTNTLEFVNADVTNSDEWNRMVDKEDRSSIITVLDDNGSNPKTSGDIYVLTFKVKSNATVGSKATISTEKITVGTNAAAPNDSVEVAAKSKSVTISNSSTPTPAPLGDQGQSGGTSGDGSTSGGSTTGGSTTGSSTAGKTDTTTANKTLPKTGVATITGGCLIVFAIASVVLYKKNKKYEEIK